MQMTSRDWVYHETGEVFEAPTREEALILCRESYRGIDVQLTDILTCKESNEKSRADLLHWNTTAANVWNLLYGLV